MTRWLLVCLAYTKTSTVYFSWITVFITVFIRLFIYLDLESGRLRKLNFKNSSCALILGGWEWALIRGWALINFSYLEGGRLFEVSAYSRLGAKSNKYGKPNNSCLRKVFTLLWNKRKGIKDWNFSHEKFFPACKTRCKLAERTCALVKCRFWHVYVA